jgi:hypothetical protein
MKNAIVTMYYFRSQDFLDVGVRLEIECATSSDRKNLKKNSFFLSFFFCFSLFPPSQSCPGLRN